MRFPDAYGLFFAGGFLAAGIVWSVHMRALGKSWSDGFEFGFWLIVSSVIGARTAYILANASAFTGEPLQMLNLRSGGLIFYGGIIGGIAAVLIFARLKQLPLPALLDVAACGVPLGHALGRMGCLLNGCCFGVPYNGPLHEALHGTARFPVQILEATGNLTLFMALIVTFQRTYRSRHPSALGSGRCAAFYLIGYGVLRFGVEFLRGDPRLTWGPLHIAQWLSLLAVTAGGLWLLAIRNPGRTT